jgi:hypothetical protein
MTTADGRTDQSTDLADHVCGGLARVGPIDRVRGVPTAEPDAAPAEIRALLGPVSQVDGQRETRHDGSGARRQTRKGSRDD